MKGICLIIALMMIAFPAFAGESLDPDTLQLKKVDAEYVCMVNDAVFASPQIPVEVGGKTYYGCCPMCEKTLKESAEARQSIDPVSGNIVDKAEAVIGALPDQSVLYFESEENMGMYGNMPSEETETIEAEAEAENETETETVETTTP